MSQTNHRANRIEMKNGRPLHLQQNFPGLSLEQVVDQLKRFTPHLIIHLGLNYSLENSGYGLTLK